MARSSVRKASRTIQQRSVAVNSRSPAKASPSGEETVGPESHSMAVAAARANLSMGAASMVNRIFGAGRANLRSAARAAATGGHAMMSPQRPGTGARACAPRRFR